MDKFLDYEIVQPQWDRLREDIRVKIQELSFDYIKRRMLFKIYGKPNFSNYHIVIQPQTAKDDGYIIDHECVWDENTIDAVESLLRLMAKDTIFLYNNISIKRRIINHGKAQSLNLF